MFHHHRAVFKFLSECSVFDCEVFLYTMYLHIFLPTKAIMCPWKVSDAGQIQLGENQLEVLWKCNSSSKWSRDLVYKVIGRNFQHKGIAARYHSLQCIYDIVGVCIVCMYVLLYVNKGVQQSTLRCVLRICIILMPYAHKKRKCQGIGWDWPFTWFHSAFLLFFVFLLMKTSHMLDENMLTQHFSVCLLIRMSAILKLEYV